MSKPKDPREDLLSQIDHSETRVKKPDSPIVLLCGGFVPEKKHPDDPEIPIASLRDAISRTHTLYETFRPEEIDNWHEDGIFKNLVAFESELAGICTLVVIILESPGSIAELGAFSQQRDMDKKLVIVHPSEYDEENSFINLGILRYIAQAKPSAVKSYPWSIPESKNENLSITNRIIDDVISEIQSELSRVKDSQVFKPDNNSHVSALIFGLIKLFIALKESEITSYLNCFGVQIKRGHLRRKLFLLQRFQLIKSQKYGGTRFYLVDRSSFYGLRLTMSGGKHIDSLRITTTCASFYHSAVTEGARIQAIKLAQGRAPE